MSSPGFDPPLPAPPAPPAPDFPFGPVPLIPALWQASSVKAPVMIMKALLRVDKVIIYALMPAG
jgi:hypothetical protein